MPWRAIAFKRIKGRKDLADKFSVRGIPRLVLVGPQGVINHDAAQAVLTDPDGQHFPWPKAEAP